MNPEAQAELERILMLTPEQLNDSEKAFLRARSSYLTTREKEIFAEVLGNASEDNTPVDDGLEELPYDELKAKADELGIEFPGNIKKVDLINLIRDVQSQNA